MPSFLWPKPIPLGLTYSIQLNSLPLPLLLVSSGVKLNSHKAFSYHPGFMGSLSILDHACHLGRCRCHPMSGLASTEVRIPLALGVCFSPCCTHLWSVHHWCNSGTVNGGCPPYDSASPWLCWSWDLAVPPWAPALAPHWTLCYDVSSSHIPATPWQALDSDFLTASFSPIRWGGRGIWRSHPHWLDLRLRGKT